MLINKDYIISQVLWYEIGGKVSYYIKVKDAKEVLDALKFLKQQDINKIFVVGIGTNLIFTDEDYPGAVIQLASSNGYSFKVEGNIVTAFAGEVLDDLINFSFDNNLIGLEWAGGLPGTVGAAVRGNVGAFGGEVKDSVFEIEVIDINTLEVKKIRSDALNFSYRNSYIKENKNLIILSVSLNLTKTNPKGVEKAKEAYYSNINYRREHHPLDYPNTGSVFKNINEKENIEKVLSVWPDVKEKVENNWYGKVSIGYMIKRLGLEGYKVGNAQVSNKHPNFIVNLGEASFNDVTSIIYEIKRRIGDVFGFVPEIEVEIVEG